MDVPYLDSHLGEVAAVSTAALRVVSSLSFTAAGREVGSSAVNLLRSVLAVAVLCAALWLRDGSPLPEFDARHWLVLGGSGIVGLAIGDQLLKLENLSFQYFLFQVFSTLNNIQTNKAK